MKSINFVERLIDFGAVESVVMGVGRAEIIGRSMIRIVFYDEHHGPDGEIERPIKHYVVWPIERFMEAHLLFMQIAAWAEEAMKEGAHAQAPTQRYGSH